MRAAEGGAPGVRREAVSDGGERLLAACFLHCTGPVGLGAASSAPREAFPGAATLTCAPAAVPAWRPSGLSARGGGRRERAVCLPRDRGTGRPGDPPSGSGHGRVPHKGGGWAAGVPQLMADPWEQSGSVSGAPVRREGGVDTALGLGPAYTSQSWGLRANPTEIVLGFFCCCHAQPCCCAWLLFCFHVSGTERGKQKGESLTHTLACFLSHVQSWAI